MDGANGNNGATDRGPDAVRQRLIAATIELMSERSPALITNKEIAARAGVNHGQIHHYFESKDDLVGKAIQAEATRYVAETLEGIDRLPRPIDTRRRYSIWRALAYLAVNNERFDLASPVIGHLLETEAARRGVDPSDIEVQAEIAVIMSMGYGWSVFQDHILRTFADYGTDDDALRDAIADRTAELFE